MKVAALQYTARDDLAQNRMMAGDLIAKAAMEGARLICLPECADLLARDKASLHEKAERQENSAFLSMAKEAA